MASPEVFDALSTRAKDFYEENGYVQLRLAHLPDFAGACEAAYAVSYRMVGSPTKAQAAFANKDGVARHLVGILQEKDPAFRMVLQHPTLVDAYRGILERPQLVFTHAKISFKMPRQAVPWFPHQDNGYKPLATASARRALAVFVFLEHAGERDGTVELFPGSHRLGTLEHTKVREDPVRGDYQLALRDPIDMPSVFVEGRAGDVLLFDGDMIHRSGISRGSSHRIALIAEVEPSIAHRLDAFGRKPQLASGSWSAADRCVFAVKSLCSPRRYWQIVRHVPPVAAAVRWVKATRDKT